MSSPDPTRSSHRRPRDLGPRLMPLTLATRVFGVCRATLYNWQRGEHAKLVSIAGVAYVDLPSVAKHLGLEAYNHRMRNCRYKAGEGWTLGEF